MWGVGYRMCDLGCVIWGVGCEAWGVGRGV